MSARLLHAAQAAPRVCVHCQEASIERPASARIVAIATLLSPKAHGDRAPATPPIPAPSMCGTSPKTPREERYSVRSVPEKPQAVATPAARVPAASAGAARGATGEAARALLVALLCKPAVLQSLALGPGCQGRAGNAICAGRAPRPRTRAGRRRKSAEVSARALSSAGPCECPPAAAQVPSTW